MAKQLSPWAIEGKKHLLKYRPKMAKELQKQRKLDEWAQNAATRAIEESARSIENGMSPLEAQSEAKKNHLFLPAEGNMPELKAGSRRRKCMPRLNVGKARIGRSSAEPTMPIDIMRSIPRSSLKSEFIPQLSRIGFP